MLVWMAVIFAGSTDLMSSRRTSRIIGPILRWFKPDITDETIRQVQLVARKTAHCAEYAILALLVWRAVRKPTRNDGRPWSWREAGLAVSVAAAYAVTDELHQSFVASRDASVGDALIDTAGAAMGMLILWSLGRRRGLW
jgi:VanZ family protein